jgi:hypothetical protein
MIDEEFALRSRERCRPNICNQSPECWVLVGAKGASKKNTISNHCRACEGRIEFTKWQPPSFTTRIEVGPVD